MSILEGVLKSYDSEATDNLLGFLKIKPDDMTDHEKKETVLDALRRIVKIEQYLGTDALFLRCLNVTVDRIKCRNIDWNVMNEEEIIDAIYVTYQENLAHQISNLSDRKRKKLANLTLKNMKSEARGELGTASALAAALAAGEAAGFALFTGTAMGMKALGVALGLTFKFSTYQAVMSFLGIAVGPIGWIAVMAIFAGGAWRVRSGVKRTRLTFVISALIVEYKAREEHMAALYAGPEPPEHPIQDLGVLTKISEADFEDLPADE